jgi:hypothetical protein
LPVEAEVATIGDLPHRFTGELMAMEKVLYGLYSDRWQAE